MGWGGKRPGAGRKRKSKPVSQSGPARVLAHPSIPRADLGPIVPPTWLWEHELAIWAIQAPHAIANGTLTQAQAESFGLYCKVKALELVNRDGDSQHMAQIRAVNTFELQFQLTAAGKPVVVAEPAAPVSKLSRFRS